MWKTVTKKYNYSTNMYVQVIFQYLHIQVYRSLKSEKINQQTKKEGG